MPELAGALLGLGCRFDRRAYDACLMGMADVFVTSEEIIAGNGYDSAPAAARGTQRAG